MADAWDYEIIWNGDDGLSGLRRRLQALGAEGWELVATVAMNGVMVLTLRRPLSPESLLQVDEDIELSQASGGGDAPTVIDLDSLAVNARSSSLLGAVRPS